MRPEILMMRHSRLIVEAAMEIATAEREIACYGEWRTDHAAMTRTILEEAEQIESELSTLPHSGEQETCVMCQGRKEINHESCLNCNGRGYFKREEQEVQGEAKGQRVHTYYNVNHQRVVSHYVHDEDCPCSDCKKLLPSWKRTTKPGEGQS